MGISGCIGGKMKKNRKKMQKSAFFLFLRNAVRMTDLQRKLANLPTFFVHYIYRVFLIDCLNALIIVFRLLFAFLPDVYAAGVVC